MIESFGKPDYVNARTPPSRTPSSHCNLSSCPHGCKTEVSQPHLEIFSSFPFFKMLVDLIQCTLSKCSKWVLASDPSLSRTKGTQLSIDVLKCAYPALRFGSIQDPSIFRSNSKQVKNHASQWVLHYITAVHCSSTPGSQSPARPSWSQVLLRGPVPSLCCSRGPDGGSAVLPRSPTEESRRSQQSVNNNNICQQHNT